MKYSFVVVAVEGGDLKQIKLVKPEKGQYMWLRDPKARFLFALWSCDVKFGGSKKEIQRTNPENVYLARGQRLRFQLINSKFPAPLSVPFKCL